MSAGRILGVSPDQTTTPQTPTVPPNKGIQK